MDDAIKLQEYEDHLVTRMGAWFPGERVVFRGLDLHLDFADADWMDLYIFGITGRRLAESQLSLLHSLWVYTSYPDPRLWNNRVAALAGTVRSTGALGLSAALAVSEATIYGLQPEIRAIDFLLKTKRRIDAEEPLVSIVKAELKARRTLPGYGRPIIASDERVQRMVKRIKDSEFESGDHVKLAFDVERVLLDGRWRMRMNFAGLSAAICADMGFSPQHFYLFAFPAFLAGMVPCFTEAIEKPEGTLLPLPCARVAYEGSARRLWE